MGFFKHKNENNVVLFFHLDVEHRLDAQQLSRGLNFFMLFRIEDMLHVAIIILLFEIIYLERFVRPIIGCRKYELVLNKKMVI